MEATGQETVLVVRTGPCACAVPITMVEEVLRPLPVDAVAGLPDVVQGFAVIRGAPVPVVDLADLLETAPTASATRFVLCRFDGRRLAIAVETVVGLRKVSQSQVQNLPPVWDGAQAALLDAVGVSDHHVLFLLQVARVIPEWAWAHLHSTVAAQ